MNAKNFNSLSVLSLFLLLHNDDENSPKNSGGWTSPKVVDDFGNYAAAVFKELGGTGKGKATDFLTMNEPKNAAFLGYAIGVHAPFLKVLADQRHPGLDRAPAHARGARRGSQSV